MRASTDLTYTRRASIYLGDVSSRLYEFIARPRPCVFLDAHDVDWTSDADFAQWCAGPVIGDVADLGPALLDAQARQEAVYGPEQERLFRYSFDLAAEPSSQRAARVVAEVAGLTAREATTSVLRQAQVGTRVPRRRYAGQATG